MINALTDDSHPCQILADLLSIQEKRGNLNGLKLAYVGDGFNNVTHSLMTGGAKVGMHVAVASPPVHRICRVRTLRSCVKAMLRHQEGLFW